MSHRKRGYPTARFSAVSFVFTERKNASFIDYLVIIRALNVCAVAIQVVLYQLQWFELLTAPTGNSVMALCYFQIYNVDR